MIYTPTIKQVEEDIVLCYYDRQKPLCSPGCKCTEEEIHDCGMDFTMWNNSQKTVKFHPDHKIGIESELITMTGKFGEEFEKLLSVGIPADAIKDRIDIKRYCTDCNVINYVCCLDCPQADCAVLKPLPLPIEEPPYQKLFNHMHDHHGLILLQTEMQEIIDIVKNNH